MHAGNRRQASHLAWPFPPTGRDGAADPARRDRDGRPPPLRPACPPGGTTAPVDGLRDQRRGRRRLGAVRAPRRRWSPRDAHAADMVRAALLRARVPGGRRPRRARPPPGTCATPTRGGSARSCCGRAGRRSRRGRRWMLARSPAHRRILLARRYRDIGAGPAPGAPAGTEATLPATTIAGPSGAARRADRTRPNGDSELTAPELGDRSVDEQDEHRAEDRQMTDELARAEERQGPALKGMPAISDASSRGHGAWWARRPRGGP